MEKRRHTRFDLREPLICGMSVDGGPALYSVIRNISVSGALVECPSGGLSFLDVDRSVELDDTALGGNNLLQSSTGRLAWNFDRYYGVEFDRAILASPEELISRLKKNNLA